MVKLSFLSQGIAQTAMVVEDLNRVVENYYRHFGIGPWHFYTYEKPFVKNMTVRGKPADYRMRIALSWFGPSRIELIQHLEGDSVYREFIMKHGYGVQHLGFLVDDMKRAVEEAGEAGFSVIMDGSGFGADGDGHYAYLDTDEAFGTTLELIQRPARKLPPERIYPEQASSR